METVRACVVFPAKNWLQEQYNGFVDLPMPLLPGMTLNLLAGDVEFSSEIKKVVWREKTKTWYVFLKRVDNWKNVALRQALIADPRWTSYDAQLLA